MAFDWVIDGLLRAPAPCQPVEPVQCPAPVDLTSILCDLAKNLTVKSRAQRVLEIGESEEPLLSHWVTNSFNLSYLRFWSPSGSLSESNKFAEKWPSIRVYHGSPWRFARTNAGVFDWILMTGLTRRCGVHDSASQLADLISMLKPAGHLTMRETFISPAPSWYGYRELLRGQAATVVSRRSLDDGSFLVTATTLPEKSRRKVAA